MSGHINERWRRLSRFWPNVATKAGRREASKWATAAIWWVAISYAVQAALGIWAPDILLTEMADGEMYGEELWFIIALAVLAVPVAVFLGWHFRKKTSLITGCAIAFWLFAEAFFKLASSDGSGRGGGVGAIVITLLFSLGAVNGLRAAWAARKMTAAES